MVMGTPCTPGRYTDSKGQLSCEACPSGRYQTRSGYAKCEFCPSGKYYGGLRANSSMACQNCTAGKYGDKTGLANCSMCPAGQYQPDVGQQECFLCSDLGKIKTNNAEHTGCVDNVLLMSTSVVEVLFTKGVALALSFSLAVGFAGLGGAMYHMKRQYSLQTMQRKKLANMPITQVLVKSILPGFSFGSEVVLVMGMLQEKRALAIVMLIFRLLHPCVVLLGVYVTYFPDHSRAFLRDMKEKARLHMKFMQKNIPLTAALFLVSLTDATMVQLMPWQESKFYEESQGFPAYGVMQVSTATKTVQSMASVICQLVYIVEQNSVNDPTTTSQAKALFALSITNSLVSLIMGMTLLALKGTLLKKVEDELDGRDKDDRLDESDDEYVVGGKAKPRMNHLWI